MNGLVIMNCGHDLAHLCMEGLLTAIMHNFSQAAAMLSMQRIRLHMITECRPPIETFSGLVLPRLHPWDLGLLGPSGL